MQTPLYCEALAVYITWRHDDVIKWEHFPRYWPFVRGIHRSPVNSPHKGLWRGALLFSLICTRINGWVNNGEAEDLRRNRAHYDVIVMVELHQPGLWFISGGYLVKRWFIPVAARARGQSSDLNREILASNLFNCHKEVINAPPVPSISRCIHIVYRHKNVWEYQWSNFIYNCMSTFLHYVRCKDALLDCSAPGDEMCESLTSVDEIELVFSCGLGLPQPPCSSIPGNIKPLHASKLRRNVLHLYMIPKSKQLTGSGLQFL